MTSENAPAETPVPAVSAPRSAQLHAPVLSESFSPPPPLPRHRWRFVLLAVVLVGSTAGGGYWWLHRVPGLPLGIVFSNGRLEADKVDIDTKFAGRISQILADEGTMVTAGQVVARIDTRDLEIQMAQARSQTVQARQVIVQDQANLIQMGAQLKLNAQELQRARDLVKDGWETREVLDQRQSQFIVGSAAYRQTEAQIAAATAAVEADVHAVDLIQVNITDNTLVAPKDGPIEYRLTNVGEVLPAGGKVFTMLDVTYVYMDIFLPTQTAGKVRIGDEASIVLDALPTQPIKATVSFLAKINEFTPKTVETQSERDKLMFRVRVRIDPVRLLEHKTEVRSGLPGVSYIRLDGTPWPASLQPVLGQ